MVYNSQSAQAIGVSRDNMKCSLARVEKKGIGNVIIKHLSNLRLKH